MKASTFAAYFVLLNYNEGKQKINAAECIELALICLGTFLSICWYFVHEGSKKWQENWEAHIDALENDITGPLYKTVFVREGYSVSGVNKWVTIFISVTWVIIFGIYFFRELTFCEPNDGVAWGQISIIVIFMTLLFLTWKNTKKAKTRNKR